MKTTMYLTAALAFAVQATVCCQTPGNPPQVSLLPVVKHQKLIINPGKTTPAIQQQLAFAEDKKEEQQIRAFTSRIGEINKQITELEALKSQVNGEINDFFVQQTPVITADALNIKQVSKEELLYSFQVQAESLYQQSMLLRKQALTQTGDSQTGMLLGAAKLEAQGIAKQIEASVLSGKISLEKFNQNNDQITLFMRSWYASQSKLEKAGDLAFDANRSMRLAIEMREEANTYPDPSAKLGAMQNAEEKEFLALSKQNEVLNMFGEIVCSN